MFPGWRWTPGLEVTGPVQTPLDPAGPFFVRCPTHVYPMNIFQEMPSHTWGPGRTQAPDHKMRKGLPLPVCSQEPEWDLGLGAEDAELRADGCI